MKSWSATVGWGGVGWGGLHSTPLCVCICVCLWRQCVQCDPRSVDGACRFCALHLQWLQSQSLVVGMWRFWSWGASESLWGLHRHSQFTFSLKTSTPGGSIRFSGKGRHLQHGGGMTTSRPANQNIKRREKSRTRFYEFYNVANVHNDTFHQCSSESVSVGAL